MANSKISALTAATTPVAGTETLPIVQGGVTKQVSIANLTAGRAVSAASLALTTPLPTTSGGTGLGSFNANQIFYASSTSAVGQSSDFTYTGSYATLGSAKQFRFYRGDNATYTELYFTTGASGGFVINNVNGNQNSFQLGGVTQWEIPDVNGNLVQKVAAKGINFTANTAATGMTSQLLNWYEEITAASTACTGAITTAVSWKLTRVGNLVTLTLPPVTGAATSSINFEFGVLIPSGYRPSSSLMFPCGVRDNDANQSTVGMCIITAAGNIRVYLNIAASANFTANASATACGFAQGCGFSCSWRL